MCANLADIKAELKSVDTLPNDDVDQRSGACAFAERNTNCNEVVPPKKRKTRRGKSKRRHPYVKVSKAHRVMKPEAPYNSNRFLIEDHGNIQELDEKLKHNDGSLVRTRDSSFSMDSDGEFYSSPDDEQEFLIKDFDDQYESLQVERLQAMSKNDLIHEYLLLEKKVELMSKRGKFGCELSDKILFEKEIERLTIENETLKRENSELRSKISESNSDTEDSESDSSDSCSSCSSRLSSPSPAAV